MLKDAALEARARAISQELRCLVCQNESIDESNADLAHDLRVLLRQRLAAGDTDRQAIDFIVKRYGDFVLLKPPVEPATYFLWFGPAAVLLDRCRRRARVRAPAQSRARRAARRCHRKRNSGSTHCCANRTDMAILSLLLLALLALVVLSFVFVPLARGSAAPDSAAGRCSPARSIATNWPS